MSSVPAVQEAGKTTLRWDQSLPIFLAVSFILCALASYLWFTPTRGHSFMGDDLEIIIRATRERIYAQSIGQDALNTLDDKFRPIANPAIGLMVRSCGMDFDCYEN